MKKTLLLFFFFCLVITAQAQSDLNTSVPATVFCSGSGLSVSYSDAVNSYLPGNVFTVQLSNASGSFTSPVTIGSLAGTAAAGTISATLPATPGNGFRIRVVSSNPVVTGNDNGTNITISPVPSAPVVASNAPVCAGSQLNISVMNSFPGATYSWLHNGVTYTGPGAGTSAIVISGAQASYSGIWSAYTSINGCTSSAGTVSVAVNQAPAAPVVTNSGPVCAGSPLQISASGSSTATYFWTMPNGASYNGPGAGTSTLSFPSASALHAGTWTVFASQSGCNASPSVTTVTVIPQPTTPIAQSNSPLCEGETLMLTAVGGLPSSLYSWVSPSGISSSLQNPTIPNATLAHSGVYTVYTASGNGCASLPGFVTVMVNPIPAADASSTSPVCEGQTLSLSATNVAGASYSWAGPNNFTSAQHNPSVPGVSPAQAGTYSVWVSQNGCIGLDTVLVSISPQPSAPVITTSGLPCEGQTLILSAGPALGNYVWTGPGGPYFGNTVTISNVQAGIYTFQVNLTVNGCQSLSALYSAQILPPPNVQITASGYTMEGDTITLSAAGAASYSWLAPASGGILGDPTLITITAVPTATTMYTLVGSNLNGCSGTAFVTVVVPVLSAPDELEASNSLLLYPNPNTGNFTVKLTDCKPGDLQIKLVNLLGQEVYAEAATARNAAFEHQLNVQNMPEGMYVLQVQQGGKRYTKQVVIQK